MKKQNKKFMVAAIAAAMTAATAVPALALENQVSGAFTSFYDISNYSASGNNGYETAPTNTRGLEDGAPNANYFVQRVRLGYTAKADEHVKLVTKFELDYNWWGNSSYATGRGSGGAIGSDSVNLETKHLYLDLSYPILNTKIGMMANNDAFKGILFDADMAGIQVSHSYDNASVVAGYFRLNDDWDWSNDTTLGKNRVDLFQLEGKYAVSKTFKVGAGYYFVKDNRDNASVMERVLLDTNPDPNVDSQVTGQLPGGSLVYAPGTFEEFAQPSNSAKVHTVGVNADAVVGPVSLNAFALKQFGDLSDTVDAKGYAVNVGAKMPVGGGTARCELMYVSGGDNAFYNAASGTEGGGYYDSEMIFLARDKNATTIDNAIVYDVSNYGQGVILGALGYDYDFSDKLSGSANLGFGAIADDKFSNATGSSDYLGTEINAEANYKLTANVTLGARAGYFMLGEYFDNVDAGRDADNPYDVKLIARYNF